MTPGRLVHVLVVEDDPWMRELLQQGLELAGYRVTPSARGEVALRLAMEDPPQLLLLDLMLPGIDGFEVCRRLREAGHDVPVIFLTASDDERAVLEGFERGGDDFVTKPFRLSELVARIGAVLKRAAADPVADAPVGYLDLRLDLRRHEAHRGTRRLELTPVEFRLLHHLVRNAEIVMSKDRILEDVWGFDAVGHHTRLETYVSYLRRKLGDPPVIVTVRGIGYVLRST